LLGESASEDKRPGLRQCAGMGRVYVKVRHGILPSAAGLCGWGRVSHSERARQVLRALVVPGLEALPPPRAPPKPKKQRPMLNALTRWLASRWRRDEGEGARASAK